MGYTMNSNMQKAGFGKRLLAFLIDHIIMSVLFVGGFMALFANDISRGPERVFALMPGFLFIVFFCYCFKDVFGASIGKWATGLAVGSCDSWSFTKPSLLRLIVRNILSFLWPIELLAILFSKDGRKLGDKIARTDVYLVR